MLWPSLSGLSSRPASSKAHSAVWRRGLIYGVDADEVNPEVLQLVEEPVELGLVSEVPGERGLAGPRVEFKVIEHAGEVFAERGL